MTSDLENSLAWQLKAVKAPEPVREFRFAPPRKFAFDFAWPDLMVAAEVDGGSWSNGRHVRGAGFHADCVKLSEAAALGWVVLRLDGAMVEDGSALALIERALSRVVKQG